MNVSVKTESGFQNYITQELLIKNFSYFKYGMTIFLAHCQHFKGFYVNIILVFFTKL